MTGADRSKGARIGRLRRSLVADRYESERLSQAIGHLEIEKQRRMSETPGPWADAVEQHIAHARKQQASGETDAAWSSLKAAQRAQLDAFTESEVEVEAKRIALEAEEKLKGWRKDAVHEVLGSARGADQPLATRVKMAREVLDEHQDNVYRKIRLLAFQLARAALLLALLLAVLVVAVWLGWASVVGNGVLVLTDWRVLVTVMTLGSVAAILSGVTSIATAKTEGRIPDLRTQWLLMSLRPLVGAGAAVLVVVVLQSGFGSTIQLSETGMYAVALLAGFSERLASNAVEAASRSALS